MASEVRIAHVNAYGSCQFFQNISENTQRGALRIRSLYLANCFRSIDTHFSQFRITKLITDSDLQSFV
ncbi:hypothetical protein T11_13142 [Trichinella zimbabwensis]|uniref:Uncharacterized protein n=1 Tax=Trichinella zimbabwensis TaxID=268475 RepID=A0A0V1HDJ8_9BILA|nr:hypothetical protein T11_13142 [Trichinella zimbabwensis]